MLVHGCCQAFTEEAKGSFSYLGYDLTDDLLFLSSEIAQHVGNNISFANLSSVLSYSRSSSAYPKTGKILTSETGDNGFYPLMPSRATAVPNADFTQREVKVIVDNQKVIDVDIELSY